MKKHIKKILIIYFIVIIFVITFKPVMTFHKSDPHRLFLTIPFHHELQKEDYVAVDIYDPQVKEYTLVKTSFIAIVTNAKGYPLVKKIGGMPGERIQIIDDSIYIEGRLLGKRHKKTSNNVQLPEPKFPPVIPENKYYIYLPHERSFDSRYLGLVDKKDIKGVLVPVF